MRLEVFYDMNNQPIQGFPETCVRIGELSSELPSFGCETFNLIARTGDEIDALLIQLGLVIDGTIADRKRRFMTCIGLRF